MPYSKDQITQFVRKRRYKSLYAYIDHLKYWAIVKYWTYGQTHGGYDAAAIPQHVYRYWHKKAMEISPVIHLVVDPKDHEWMLSQLIE